MNRIDPLRTQYGRLMASDAYLGVPDGWIGLVDRYLDEVNMVLAAGDHAKWYVLRRIKTRYGQLEISAEVGWPRLPEDVVRRLHEARTRAEDASRTTCDVCGATGGRLRYSEVDGIVIRCPEHSKGLET